MAHENLFKIHIPDPCFEDWDKMTPNEQGAFCKVCSKTVVDFSKKTEDEIQMYISANLDKKICGRFNVSQLEQDFEEIPKLKINIEKPNYTFPYYLLPVMTPFRVSALALMLCASAMLSSCGNSGTSGGDDKPLTGAVELVNDSAYRNTKNVDTAKVPDINKNIQGGISIKDAQKLNCNTDSSKTNIDLNHETIGKIRVEPKNDTLKTDTTETMLKGEIAPKRKMGVIMKKQEEK